MDIVILFFCSLMSCVIVVNIFFQFLDDRYIKYYKNMWIYILLKVAGVIILSGINMLKNPYMNGIFHMIFFATVSYIFYYESSSKKIFRVLEAEVLFMIFVISEGIGVFFIDILLGELNIVPQSLDILQSIETTFSTIVLLFLYFGIFSRLWKKCLFRTKTQYLLYFIMFIYSSVNILAIAVISNRENRIIIILNVGCTIFANMYLLYFVRYSDERNYYKAQVEMMEQQQQLKFQGYENQQEMYTEAMKILHDVNKHIKMIEELHKEGYKQDAIRYTRQINDMLRPLMPFRFSNNPTLNCLLTDKLKTADKYNIDFEIDVFIADFEFMRPIDITTLFGNLLDNAIAGCQKCIGNRQMKLQAKSHNDLLVIRLVNSVNETIYIKKGKIINDRKVENGHGIGLLNIQQCVEHYNGSIIFKNVKEFIICDIILNKQEIM